MYKENQLRKDNMKTNTKVVAGAIILAQIATLMTLFINPPATWDYSWSAFHFSLGASVFTVLLHVGAAALFLMSFNVYKAKLQRAFLGIVLGVVLVALGTFQLPVIDALDKWNSAYVTNGYIGLPFLISGLVIYFGGSAFGRLVGSKGLLTNRLVVLSVTLGLTAVVAALPHVQTTVSELEYDTGNAVLSWTMFLFIVTALIFLRVRQNIGAHYKNAMLWTAFAMLASASCLAIAIFDVLTSTATRDTVTEFLNVLIVIAGFVWLKAGYAFTVTKEY
jgi:hypothetical protein